MKILVCLISLFTLLAVGITACVPTPSQAVPTVEATNTATQTNTPAPTGTPTQTPTPTVTPSPTVTPTLEPRLPSAKPPVVSPGAVLSPENAGRVVELAGWGEGYDFQFSFLSQLIGSGRILVQTELPDPAGLISRTRFWEVPSGTLRLELIYPEGYAALYGSPDGTRFAIYQNYCQREDPQPCLMVVRSFPENDLLVSFDPGLVFNAAFSPNNRFLAVSNRDGIAVWDLSTGKLERVLSPSGENAIYDILEFSHDGKMLAGTQNMGDGTVDVWQVEDGEQLAGLVSISNNIAPGYSPTEVEFSPDDKFLVLVYGGLAVVWKTSDWSQGPTWAMDELNGITRLAFSPDGRLIASGGSRGSITLGDAATGTVLRSWDLHSDETYDYISDLSFSADGRLLISLSMDQTLRFWGIQEKKD